MQKQINSFEQTIVLKEAETSPAQMAQVVGASSVHQKATGLIRVEAHMGGNQFMFFSLSLPLSRVCLSLSLSLPQIPLKSRKAYPRVKL